MSGIVSRNITSSSEEYAFENGVDGKAGKVHVQHASTTTPMHAMMMRITMFFFLWKFVTSSQVKACLH
jgi:hypothetical protein